MKGICFIEPLFKKTIEGTKTQTRRLAIEKKSTDLFGNEVTTISRAKYNFCDLLYLKEPYIDDITSDKTFYKYDPKDIEELIQSGFEEEMKIPGWWRNKLFMPESAARYFIEITGVCSERLQDISNEDCIKEGIYKHISHARVYWKNGYDGLMYQTPRDAYAWLINEINGKGTWESNPYVWVYEYKVKY